MYRLRGRTTSKKGWYRKITARYRRFVESLVFVISTEVLIVSVCRFMKQRNGQY